MASLTTAYIREMVERTIMEILQEAHVPTKVGMPRPSFRPRVQTKVGMPAPQLPAKISKTKTKVGYAPPEVGPAGDAAPPEPPIPPVVSDDEPDAPPRKRPSEIEAERAAARAAQEYFRGDDASDPDPEEEIPSDSERDEEPWIPYRRLNLEEKDENNRT